MGAPGGQDHGFGKAARSVVVFLGLYQGAVPLVVRPLFDRDQRFAPALWLPAPWWWLACIAIVAVAVALLAAIHATEQRPSPDASDPQPGTRVQRHDATRSYDAASAIVFLVGIYNGVAPFVARLVFDGDLLLALPLRLPAPWWWITSIAVVIATTVLLTLIDRAKQQRSTG